ncbi:MAG: hypothetical protein ABI151_18450 [Chitinophagaceae bacterium]
MKKILILVIVAANLFASCKKEDKPQTVFKGPEVMLHDGKAWSVVKTDASGLPVELTITLNDAVLSSVPVGSGGHGGHDQSNSVMLPLHEKVKTLTPFKYIIVDYNPDGHEPQAVYGLPHFDFHFYLMSDAERLAIPPYEVDSSKFVAFPAPGMMPANYIPIPGGVPQMGTHWVDVTSPELSGQKFTQTFIYGSYNNSVTFYEPMVTLDYMKTTAEFNRSIPQPAKVAVSGYYPTKMKIVKHDGVSDVTLTSFVYR